MRRLLLILFCPCALFAQATIEQESMLHQASLLAETFQKELAKAPPPSFAPEPLTALNTASVWFSLDLTQIQTPLTNTLNDELALENLREMGVQGIYLKGLKNGGTFRTAIGIDPKWRFNWDQFANTIQRKGIALITDSVSNATGLSADFALALKNYKNYPNLYHLVEIEQRDWKFLPKLPTCALSANVPWLTIQKLHQKGYVPESFSPYVKTSSWNATGPIRCIDGKVRRWIYLKENKDDPIINWLSPSFGGSQIAAADMLDSVYNLGQKIARIDGEIEKSSRNSLTLLTRKLGNFSALKTQKGVQEWKSAETDLIIDHLTKRALLHALLTEDSGALKLMYEILLQEGIEIKRLVHELQPFDQFSCDYSELIAEPKKRLPYYDEILTSEALRVRLLKEDIAALKGEESSTWPTLCKVAVNAQNFTENREAIAKAHLLLAFVYAMQPGVFSFSGSDLLGMTTNEPFSLMDPNENSLYGSLSSQMGNRCSFARRLQTILSVRAKSGIERAELIGVLNTRQKGLFVLLFQLENSQMLQMLAVNFSKGSATERYEIPAIRDTTAIDLLTGLAEKKPLNSSKFQIEIPPLSAKAILFQTKYYP